MLYTPAELRARNGQTYIATTGTLMVLTEGDIAMLTIVLYEHRTTDDGNCACGRSKKIPVPEVTTMLTQQAHQAEVVARALHLKAIKLPPLH